MLRSRLEEWNYFNDSRVAAMQKGKWYVSFDERSMTAIVLLNNPGIKIPKELLIDPKTIHLDETVTDDDTEQQVMAESDGDEGLDVEYIVRVNVKFVVCPLCKGKGKHVNPSIDASGISAEDFEDDPSFKEDYLSGLFDVPCFACKGERVQIELDREANPPLIVKAIDEKEEQEAHFRAMERMERAMGC